MSDEKNSFELTIRAHQLKLGISIEADIMKASSEYPLVSDFPLIAEPDRIPSEVGEFYLKSYAGAGHFQTAFLGWDGYNWRIIKDLFYDPKGQIPKPLPTRNTIPDFQNWVNNIVKDCYE